MLVRLDAALRARSFVGWCVFRAVAGFLVAGGLASWLAAWFEKNFWLRAVQSVLWAVALAGELGILPNHAREAGTGGDAT